MLLVLFAQVSCSKYVLLYSFLSVCPVFVGVCERGYVREGVCVSYAHPVSQPNMKKNVSGSSVTRLGYFYKFLPGQFFLQK